MRPGRGVRPGHRVDGELPGDDLGRGQRRAGARGVTGEHEGAAAAGEQQGLVGGGRAARGLHHDVEPLAHRGGRHERGRPGRQGRPGAGLARVDGDQPGGGAGGEQPEREHAHRARAHHGHPVAGPYPGAQHGRGGVRRRVEQRGRGEVRVRGDAVEQPRGDQQPVGERAGLGEPELAAGGGAQVRVAVPAPVAHLAVAQHLPGHGRADEPAVHAGPHVQYGAGTTRGRARAGRRAGPPRRRPRTGRGRRGTRRPPRPAPAPHPARDPQIGRGDPPRPRLLHYQRSAHRDAPLPVAFLWPCAGPARRPSPAAGPGPTHRRLPRIPAGQGRHTRSIGAAGRGQDSSPSPAKIRSWRASVA